MIRTGKQYFDSLRDGREVYIDGERVRDVTQDPRLAGAAETVAELYDLQHDAAVASDLTYASPKTGNPVALSFIEPKSRDDLERRGRAFAIVAEKCSGLFGRTPDFMNAGLAAIASASQIFDTEAKPFGSNVRRYYEDMREQDLTMTHIQVNPQVDRTKTVSQQSTDIALKTVGENDAGFYVNGMRLVGTLAQFSNEILVMPSVVVTNDESAADYALAFSVPVATPGVKIISRPTLIPQNAGHFLDHPLSSRFDEGDATIVFDRVLIPWENAFIYRDVEKCNQLYKQSFLAEHYTHQTQTRALAKTEFMASLAIYIAKSTKIDAFPNVQGQLAELLMFVEGHKAMLAQAIATSSQTPFGTFAPNRWPLHTSQIYFYERYDKMINAVRALAAGGLVAAPSYAEFDGEIGELIERYFATASMDSEKRIRMLRLAWDASVSGFSGRQSLYERFYQGDPVRRATAYYRDYPIDGMIKRVDRILDDLAARAAHVGQQIKEK
jgi:4-hydroxyphenylacetate 3-monooxygenase